MALYQEILCEILSNDKIEATFPNSAIPVKEMELLPAVRKIKEIIECKECFEKTEEIVLVFEKLGSDGGNRHDF